MSDDWRVIIELPPGGEWREIVDRLRDDEIARAAHGHAVALSHEHETLRAYADTPDAVEGTRDAIVRLLSDAGYEPVAVEVERWHAEEERWEDGSVPLPRTPAEHAAERERLQAQEAAESAEAGGAEWEVDAELPSRHAAVELEDRLRGEGLPVRRWWRVVRAGAATEDDAKALADRIRGEAPAGTQVNWQGAASEAWSVVQPFPELGGLAN